MSTAPARSTRQFVLAILCAAALILGLGAALAPTATGAPDSAPNNTPDVVLHGEATYVPSLQRVSGMLAPPIIDGTAQVGQRLTATPGEWAVDDLDFEYQWLLDGVEVDDAVDRTFTPPALALGAEVSVDVTVWGLRSRGVTVRADPVGPVTRGVLPVKVKPKLSGKPRVGAWLSVSRPVTKPKSRVTYRWFVDGNLINGAKGTRLKLVKSMVGTRVSVEVTLRAPGYAPRTYGARTIRIR